MVRKHLSTISSALCLLIIGFCAGMIYNAAVVSKRIGVRSMDNSTNSIVVPVADSMNDVNKSFLKNKLVQGSVNDITPAFNNNGSKGRPIKGINTFVNNMIYRVDDAIGDQGETVTRPFAAVILQEPNGTFIATTIPEIVKKNFGEYLQAKQVNGSWEFITLRGMLPNNLGAYDDLYSPNP